MPVQGSKKDLGYVDAFGKLIADSTTNELDIGSQYEYNQERWDLYVDGSKVFPEYVTVDQYNHVGDVHELRPNAGEKVTFETREIPRYVVQYEQEVTFAFSINQQLQSGDEIRVGNFTDLNGWFARKLPSHESNEIDIIIRRGGVDKKIRTVVLPQPIINFTRLSNRFNWYNVGRSFWVQTFTENNIQKNEEIGSISIDDGTRGPKEGNLPLRYEVIAGGSTDNLVLEAGSVAMVTLGDVDKNPRVKSEDFVDSVTSTGVWEPLRAFRHQTNREDVNVQLFGSDILNYSSDDKIKLFAMAFDRSKVNFGSDGWSMPEGWSRQNNALETRTDITDIPSNDGTLTPTTSSPGGYQVGRSVLIPISGQLQKGASKGGGGKQKRGFSNKSYCVVLGKSGSTGDVTYETAFEQDF